VAISDIHYASKWDNPNLVEYAYEIAEKENCNFVTNSGDIFEGDFHQKRPEHLYQVKKIGIEQLDYVAKVYPKSDIPTYFITGNHCGTFIKTCGANIGKMLEDKRPDLTYMGHDLADIKVGKLKIRLRHGIGGNAYAKGYKLQKYCETLPLNDIPDIILQGHYHYSAYFKNRDIHCFNVPSLQSYTPFAKSLGLPQEIGFWYIVCNLDSKGNLVSITPELYQFNEKQKIKRKEK
jgi:predicted phosphodiesterase